VFVVTGFETDGLSVRSRLSRITVRFTLLVLPIWLTEIPIGYNLTCCRKKLSDKLRSIVYKLCISSILPIYNLPIGIAVVNA